jgi:hypothetical protein
MIEAYSFHTSSRFGGRVRVSAEDGLVSVTGPRMGVTVFRVWLTIQGGLLIITFSSFVAGLVLVDPWYLLLAAGSFALHVWGCMGGTAVWGLMDLMGHETATFRVDEVNGYRKGAGWSRGAPRFLIPFYVLFIDKISPGPIVSFEAPDGKARGNVIYALMLWYEEDTVLIETMLDVDS